MNSGVCILVLISMMIFVLFSTLANASESISSCQVISSPGYYVLNSDILDSPNFTCITINSNDVIFDGQNYNISSGIENPFYWACPTQRFPTSGILVVGDASNVTIENTYLTHWGAGIELWYASNNTIKNNILTSNYMGIYLNGSSNNIIHSNILENNSYGLSIEYGFDSIIYNNFFNNSNNSFICSWWPLCWENSNYWNITKSLGINIVGGFLIGGNFWSNSSGNDFSQECVDADYDGICDSSYFIDSNNTDYLPLKIPFNIIQNLTQRVAILEYNISEIRNQSNICQSKLDELQNTTQNLTDRVDLLESITSSLAQSVQTIQDTLNNFMSKIITFLSSLSVSLKQQMVCGYMAKNNMANATELGLYCDYNTKGRCVCRTV